MNYPLIIQGGMGVAVSNWRLARAVSELGQLGVVSGTFLDSVIARRLQDGDPDKALRRAFKHFPVQDMAERVWSRYFIKGGKRANEPYRPVPMFSLNPPKLLIELTIIANFAEVYLAKEGHNGLVGINYLTKIELPTLPSLFGAMLAGVDYVLMGAGIPKAIPCILDKLSRFQAASLKLDVQGATADDVFELIFDPAKYIPLKSTSLQRPQFLAIVSSITLAQTLVRKSNGKVDGFVIEHHSAGGHNAPPRGGVVVDENGEPIYGARDECNLEEFQKLGLPYWIAGSWGSPEKLKSALAAGAQGIQVGTAFAFCQESGIRDDIKQQVLEKVRHGTAKVFTDPRASSSGYPFKIVELAGSLSEQQVYESRSRVCDLGYLRSAYKRADGSVGFRCPGEAVNDYVKKGGDIQEVEGRKCLCNGLMSTVGYAQRKSNGYLEPPLVTAGKELSSLIRFIPQGKQSYSASDVLSYLLRVQHQFKITYAPYQESIAL